MFFFIFPISLSIYKANDKFDNQIFLKKVMSILSKSLDFMLAIENNRNL